MRPKNLFGASSALGTGKKRVAATISLAMIAAAFSLGAPTAALAAPAPAPYSNGFEDVNDTSPPAPSTSPEAVIGATRVASGTGGITAADGSWYGYAATGAAPFTRLGGYSATFPTGGYTTSVDIYLDGTTLPADLRFDWSSAINTSTVNPITGLPVHLRDFVFNVGTDGAGGFVVSASNNATRSGANPYIAANRGTIATTAGWYTFEHRFYDSSGILAVDMTVRDSLGASVYTATLSNPADVIATVGGNRYGWIVFNELPTRARRRQALGSRLGGPERVEDGHAGPCSRGTAAHLHHPRDEQRTI